MSRKYDEDFMFNPFTLVISGIGILVAITAIVWGTCALGRYYDVWAQRKHGEAELARAESNRSIKTLERKPKWKVPNIWPRLKLSGLMGAAEANRIIGDSLRENEGYLRYLWIHNLAESSNQVIYVPTEANLPILEANRLKQGVQSW